MIFRKAKKEEINRILEIIEQAKENLKNLGVNQWQNGYPNIETIASDIEKNISYVLEENKKIVAVSVLTFEKESSYEKIENGNWLTNDKYGVIHRIAVDTKLRNKGYSTKLLEKLEEVCKSFGINSIKVDTHEENMLMQKLLTKNGYKYCGIIYLDKEPSIGEKRIALEKIIT